MDRRGVDQRIGAMQFVKQLRRLQPTQEYDLITNTQLSRQRSQFALVLARAGNPIFEGPVTPSGLLCERTEGDVMPFQGILNPPG